MEFPWRCNVDTIAMDLKVSWEMSVRMPWSWRIGDIFAGEGDSHGNRGNRMERL